MSDFNEKMNDTYFNLTIIFNAICFIVILVCMGLIIHDCKKDILKEINKPTRVYYEYNVVGNDTIPVDTVMVKF